MRRLKVLLVDDSRTARMIARLALGGAFDVVEAESGEQALVLVAAERPDVVLLDVVMPGLSGLEVLARLRASEATRHVPVLLTTTRGEAAQAPAVGAPCDGVLEKPLEAEVVRARLSALLSA